RRFGGRLRFRRAALTDAATRRTLVFLGPRRARRRRSNPVQRARRALQSTRSAARAREERLELRDGAERSRRLSPAGQQIVRSDFLVRDPALELAQRREDELPADG